MRVLATFFAIVLVMMAVATLINADQSSAAAKSICTAIKAPTGVIRPSTVLASQLTGMTNRGSGSYGIAIAPCTTGPALPPCNGVGFVAITNSSGCAGTFDTALGRPSVLTAGNGFSVMYGSSMNSDTFSMTVLCSESAGLGITSASKKFATRPNKQGGTGYLIVVQSKAACASGAGPTPPSPPPAPPAGKQCTPQTINGQSVTFNWAPQYLELVDGFGPETGFLFSPCKNSPQAPSWIPGGSSCSTGFGYITMFNGNGCDSWSWDTITDFGVSNSQVNLTYTSSKQPGLTAKVTIICMMGVPVITSPGGNFRNVSNTFHFELGIQDLCGGQTFAPWTAPPRPASLSSSTSGGGSSNMPSGGSGSGSMPSGGSGSMPSGGSGSMPSGGSGSSDMPSGGSMSSDMPSGGSSDQPSGDQPSGDQPSGDQPSGDQPSGDEPSGMVF